VTVKKQFGKRDGETWSHSPQRVFCREMCSAPTFSDIQHGLEQPLWTNQNNLLFVISGFRRDIDICYFSHRVPYEPFNTFTFKSRYPLLIIRTIPLTYTKIPIVKCDKKLLFITLIPFVNKYLNCSVSNFNNTLVFHVQLYMHMEGPFVS
jgi:hypothetical protein